MTSEEVERALRRSDRPDPTVTDMKKLKSHFVVGFCSAVLIAVWAIKVVYDVQNGRLWWTDAFLLVLAFALAGLRWQQCRKEWQRLAARLEPEASLP